MKEAINRFSQTIKEHYLIKKGDTIIIGSSGGPDSQFLSYLFYEIKDEYNLDIILAHLNHMHRKEAYKDEKLVIETSKKLGYKVKTCHRDMDEYAKIHKISPEDAGRRLRYKFFNELASQHKNAKIAVAHNLDDQAETIIMRLARGTGPMGLAGMDYKNNNIIRPILDFSKAEILAYLDKNAIAYALDQTNLSNDYTRNYIRNEIIPRMELINPSTKQNIFSLTELIKNDQEIINDLVDEKYDQALIKENKKEITFNKEYFENLSNPLKSHIIRKAWGNLKGDLKNLSKENIDDFISIVSLSDGKKIIKDDIEFIKSYDKYVLLKMDDKESRHKEVYLILDEEIIFNDYKIKASIKNVPGKRSRNIGYFPKEKLSFPLLVRARENGDRFKPYGMNHKKKIKDFFIDQKVDRYKRDEIPLIISNNDIIWVVGYRQSDDYKIGKEDREFIKIEVIND